MGLNFSKWREDGFRWVDAYRDKVGHELFDTKYRNLWCIMESLPYSSSINIPVQVNEDEWELFVKLACLYMYDHPKPTVLFNDSFTVIYHPGYYIEMDLQQAARASRKIDRGMYDKNGKQ